MGDAMTSELTDDEVARLRAQADHVLLRFDEGDEEHQLAQWLDSALVEVLRLRAELAAERRRAEGALASREHVASLYDERTRQWTEATRQLNAERSAIRVRAMRVHAALWRAMNDAPQDALAAMSDDGYLHDAVHAMFNGPGAIDFDAATKAHVEAQDRRIELLEARVADAQPRRLHALEDVARRAESLLLARDEDMSPKDEHAKKLGDAIDALRESETIDQTMARQNKDFAEAAMQAVELADEIAAHGELLEAGEHVGAAGRGVGEGRR